MSRVEQRERARSMATRIVAFAIGAIGLLLVAFAVALFIAGGAGLVLLGAIVLLMGLAMAGIGFFFQLVPLRLEELAGMKRDYDQRSRERNDP